MAYFALLALWFLRCLHTAETSALQHSEARLHGPISTCSCKCIKETNKPNAVPRQNKKTYSLCGSTMAARLMLMDPFPSDPSRRSASVIGTSLRSVESCFSSQYCSTVTQTQGLGRPRVRRPDNICSS